MSAVDCYKPTHRIMLSLAVLVVVAATFSAPGLADAAQPNEHKTLGAEAASLPLNEHSTQRYEISKGDTLSAIFDANGIASSLLYRLLEADVEYLSLETLQPGNRLTFRYDRHQTLEVLTLRIDAARTITFTRQDDGAFVARKQASEAQWDSSIARGTIRGSFYASAVKSGLTEAQVAEVAHLLKSRVDFRRDIRAGDTFTVIKGHEMTHTMPTGRQRIEAVSLRRGSHVHNAFLYNYGSYYDEKGDSVLRAFLRWPTNQIYRISSPFSPARLHPVTGRRSPHNGVDLATPVGTPVMSTGSGVIARVGNHPFAGRYIDIHHSGSFETRYLHLSKVLVREGQKVRRGDTIALTGNTGRSTGPHLHFEFHVNGKPVNPVTADIPTAARVPERELRLFKAQASRLMTSMQAPIGRETFLATGSPQTARTIEEKQDSRDIN